MKRLHSMTAFALAGLVGLSALSAPIAASASEEGKRNTTIGLGAAAVALLLTQKNKLPGLLAAGGAAYAYSQYNRDVQARHRYEREGYSYNDRYPRQNDGYRYRQDYNDNSFNADNGYRYHQDNNQNFRDNGSQNYRDNTGSSRWNHGNSDRHFANRAFHAGR